MKHVISFAVLFAAVFCCFGCTPAYEPQNGTDVNAMPVARMETEVTDQYAAIVWDERFYVPFCPVGASACGRQIGIVDGDDQEKVFEFKGHSVDEWIVNAHSPHDGAMLLREIQVQNTPDGLVSEYDWNNEIP